MTDNIRPSLYEARYECILTNKAKNPKNQKVTIAGKCCESGDILLKDVKISEVESGDILLVSSTGAYGYSMASNYNKILKPPVVSVLNGESKIICKRQTYENLIELELM